MKTKIIFEDESILVIHKPAGLATQSAKIGEMDVVSELKTYLAKNGKNAYVGVVHRLDQPVEGLLIFAKTKEAAAKLSSQLGQHILNKLYTALVWVQGDDSAEKGDSAHLENWLLKEGSVGKIVPSRETHAEAKKAILDYRIIEKKDRIALAEITLETGRFHQIRLQMSGAGMSLLSDRKYGTTEAVQAGMELGLRNVALCATGISFKHPKTGKAMEYRITPSFLDKFTGSAGKE